MKKVCVCCKKTYDNRNKKYCSNTCKDKDCNIIQQCENCDVMVKRNKNQYNGKVFCSRECYRGTKRGKVNVDEKLLRKRINPNVKIVLNHPVLDIYLPGMQIGFTLKGNNKVPSGMSEDFVLISLKNNDLSVVENIIWWKINDPTF